MRELRGQYPNKMSLIFSIETGMNFRPNLIGTTNEKGKVTILFIRETIELPKPIQKENLIFLD